MKRAKLWMLDAVNRQIGQLAAGFRLTVREHPRKAVGLLACRRTGSQPGLKGERLISPK